LVGPTLPSLTWSGIEAATEGAVEKYWPKAAWATSGSTWDHTPVTPLLGEPYSRVSSTHLSVKGVDSWWQAILKTLLPAEHVSGAATAMDPLSFLMEKAMEVYGEEKLKSEVTKAGASGMSDYDIARGLGGIQGDLELLVELYLIRMVDDVDEDPGEEEDLSLGDYQGTYVLSDIFFSLAMEGDASSTGGGRNGWLKFDDSGSWTIEEGISKQTRSGMFEHDLWLSRALGRKLFWFESL
jgi:hypothetical protein